MDTRQPNPQPAKAPSAPRGGGHGRPSLYRPAYCTALLRYFGAPPQQTGYKKTYYADGALKSEESVATAQPLPTFQGFAHSIGVSGRTLLGWAERHAAFGEAYARAKELQEHIWIVNSLCGLYNSSFAQFFGRNCLGFTQCAETQPATDAVEIVLGEGVRELAE